jgi:hypothetical protein
VSRVGGKLTDVRYHRLFGSRHGYAFVFGQKGLMAGIGLQGSKITKITPGK